MFTKLLKNNENKILIFSLSLIIAFTIFSFLGYIPIFNEIVTPENVLATNAQILATIFAITISLTLLGLQYLSQSLTPRIMELFLKSKFIYGLILSYAFGITANLFIISFPDICHPKEFVFYSFLLMIWCLLYLIGYLFFMIRKIQPSSMLTEIKKQIPDDYDKKIIQQYSERKIVVDDENKFIDLEQIIIKTIRNNDFFSYLDCLRVIFKKQKEYLNHLLDDKPQNKNDYERIHYNAEAIIIYFLRVNKQIYREIIRERNERFMGQYIQELTDVIKILIKLKVIRASREINNHYNNIGFKLIELRFQSLFRLYSYLLGEIVIEEFEIIPNGNSIPIFREKIQSKKDITEKEKYEEHLAYANFEFLNYNRIKFLKELAKQASNGGYTDLIISIKDILSDLLIKTIKKDDNERLQTNLLNSRHQALQEIHIYSIEKGIETLFYGVTELDDKLEVIKDNVIFNRIGEAIASFYCDGERKSVMHDQYGALHSLGWQGRTLVTKYPKITELIANALGICLEYAKKNPEKLKNLNVEMIVRELYSIKVWNKNKHGSINIKVDEIIKKQRVKTIVQKNKKSWYTL